MTVKEELQIDFEGDSAVILCGVKIKYGKVIAVTNKNVHKYRKFNRFARFIHIRRTDEYRIIFTYKPKPKEKPIKLLGKLE